MDGALVERARNGDREAFGRLAAGSIDRLYTVAYRVLRDEDEARDATQQALLEAWRDLRTLRDPARWEAWTYRLLVRACYRQRRRERGRASVPLLDRHDPSVADASAAFADRDELERGFAMLSPEHRAVVVLHHFAGLPLTEVASALGIPAGTARSRLHHALRQLRTALTEPAPATAHTEGRA